MDRTLRLPPRISRVERLLGSVAHLRGDGTRDDKCHDAVAVQMRYQDALNLVASLPLQRGDKVWLEDPNYPPTGEALKAARATLVPTRVDAEGLRVSDGLAQARRAELAAVTPSHQSPLGVALSLPRRLALLSWAGAGGAWIIEDDCDSEFRYIGRPLPALKSLDRDGRVLYIGTFSKVLYPSLRLGYLVVPGRPVRALQSTATFGGATLSSASSPIS